MDNTKSLSESQGTVDTTKHTGYWRKLLAFLGPAYLVSVGYMDPGNWATDIAGGSAYGYTLIWVLVLSNVMAILFQSLSARLGVVRGVDLAQASREAFPPVINICLYVLAEIAVSACDLAEVLGFAIGLKLLFKLPILWGVIFALGDTILLLVIMRLGVRKIEAFIISLVAVMGIAFMVELGMAHPDYIGMAKGIIPKLPDQQALLIAIGIIGATVMPHNLYLHSALVQSRLFKRDEINVRRAIRFNNIDSIVALNLAMFVNVAILVLAASVFYKNGLYHIAAIEDAYQLLRPLLGSYWAPILFAIALIASGQSSTVTGTLAGQVVMEGYINLRISPLLRRIITRLLAVVPSAIVISLYGERQVNNLLILSQVVLSLQLSFAVIPLIHFVSDRNKMKQYTLGVPYRILAWICAGIIAGLNAILIGLEAHDFLPHVHILVQLLIWGVIFFVAVLTIYVVISPLIVSLKGESTVMHSSPVNLKIHAGRQPSYFKRITIAVDFSEKDSDAIQLAISVGGKVAHYYLVHVAESAASMVWGSSVEDLESQQDADRLGKYVQAIQDEGYSITSYLGFGRRAKIIAEASRSFNSDLLVMGAHGHHTFKDFIFGETITQVRHLVDIPVLTGK